MRLAIITESYAPLRTSAAVQLEQLAKCLQRKGHRPLVMVPSAKLGCPSRLERVNGIEVLRLNMPFDKGEGNWRRAAYELCMPFAMAYHWQRSRHFSEELDGVVWYSPSIFHGIFAKRIMQAKGCRGYLILRDLFPEWAVDVGILSRSSPAYWMFRLVARHQYRTASVVGVQSPGNLPFLAEWEEPGKRRIEVLHNWSTPSSAVNCSIKIAASRLEGRKLFVYAGNMGAAQDIDLFIDLADRMRARTDIGFVLVGRGTRYNHVVKVIDERGLDNVFCHDEIPPDEIAGLYAQCSVGLVSLNFGHTSHNIPGKFISYMAHGLPTLAAINPGNDLVRIIEDNAVGRVVTRRDLDALETAANDVLLDIEAPARARELAERLYSTDVAAQQVLDGLCL